MVRRANLRLLERATPDDLTRVGVHAERGDESVGHLRSLYAGHDLLHRRQIERIRVALLQRSDSTLDTDSRLPTTDSTRPSP